jgi:5'-nucleotidase
VVAVCLVAPIGAQQLRQPPPYRILVTNDDGVRAPGLSAIAQILQLIGTPIIIGPAENQSGTAHSVVTGGRPVYREDLTLPNGLQAIGLTATPATAMRIALRNILMPRPDLVVSGINRGYNLGFSAYESGTVGAAREAAMHGIPAIAASLAASASQADIVSAAEEVFGAARRVKQYGLPPNTFLNVNVPAVPAGGFKGYLITTPAVASANSETFVENKHPVTGRPIYWGDVKEGGVTAPEGTDIWAVANGYVSVTPMKLGEHDPAQTDTLRAIFK